MIPVFFLIETKIDGNIIRVTNGPEDVGFDGHMFAHYPFTLGYVEGEPPVVDIDFMRMDGITVPAKIWVMIASDPPHVELVYDGIILIN